MQGTNVRMVVAAGVTCAMSAVSAVTQMVTTAYAFVGDPCSEHECHTDQWDDCVWDLCWEANTPSCEDTLNCAQESLDTYCPGGGTYVAC